MYKAATAKTRAAIDGFAAGDVSIQGNAVQVPITVTDALGNVVATETLVLRATGECSGLGYDPTGNITGVSLTSTDTAIGAIETVLATFSKIASDPSNTERATAVGDDLLTYLVTVNLLPR
jgi:hypothetical protein